MPTVRDVMDALAAPESDPLARRSLYGDLAPLYAFERERMRDHDAIAAFVLEQAPAGTSAVVAGACGPGYLLAALDSQVQTAVGIDREPRMLEIAAGHTDAPLVAADLTSFVAPERFDVYTLLGGSIAHLSAGRPRPAPSRESGRDRDDGRRREEAVPRDAVRTVLANAYGSLRPGGVFVCDFMARGTLRSGHVSETTFDSDRFEVTRTVLTTGTDDGTDGLGAAAAYVFAYQVTDTRVGDTVRVGTTTPIREFAVPKLLGAALSAGFDDATVVGTPTHGRGLVARRGD